MVKNVKDGIKKGAWSSEEDELLIQCVKLHGQGKWRSLAEKAGNIIIYLFVICIWEINLLVYFFHGCYVVQA